jgi:hypothetical protein
MLNYYREHLENYGPKTEPLAALARDDFKWDETTWKSNPAYQQCFDKLKQEMLNAPILAYPDFTKEFSIQTDASKYGAGAVLYQYDNDKRVVVSYGSWLFDKTQRNYNTTERELLALVLATRKWKPYLRGAHFLAETDHQPLEGYMNLSDPYGKIARWAAELTQFNFKIKYIRGIVNIPPDTLSRLHEDALILYEYSNCTTPSKMLSKTFTTFDEEVLCILEAEEQTILLNQLNYSLPTNFEYIKGYKEDEFFSGYYNYIKDKKLPPSRIENNIKNDTVALDILRHSHQYLIGKEDGKLYYCPSPKLNPDKLVLCIPSKFRKLILQECHDSLWAGAHMGRDKTIDKIQDKYYFKDMIKYVEWYINTCNICQATKRKHPSPKVIPLGTIEAKFTWDLLCLDLWDSGVISTRGN